MQELIIGIIAIALLLYIFSRKKEKPKSGAVVGVGVIHTSVRRGPTFKEHALYTAIMVGFALISPAILHIIYPFFFEIQSKGWLPTEAGSFGDRFSSFVLMAIVACVFALIANAFTYKMKQLPNYAGIVLLFVLIYQGYYIF